MFAFVLFVNKCLLDFKNLIYCSTYCTFLLFPPYILCVFIVDCVPGIVGPVEVDITAGSTVGDDKKGSLTKLVAAVAAVAAGPDSAAINSCSNVVVT